MKPLQPARNLSYRVDRRFHNITQECARASAFINEDHSDYCNAWQEKTPLTENIVSLYSLSLEKVTIFCLQESCQRPEFKYTTADELDSLPFTAFLDLYGGGGYVYRMNVAQKDIEKELVMLQNNHWVNNHTRAVFLEFAVYNAQVCWNFSCSIPYCAFFGPLFATHQISYLSLTICPFFPHMSYYFPFVSSVFCTKPHQ